MTGVLCTVYGAQVYFYLHLTLKTEMLKVKVENHVCDGYYIALPIEDPERNLTKSILARVCTLNVCGYSTLLRSVQSKVHKNTLLKQDIYLL